MGDLKNLLDQLEGEQSIVRQCLLDAADEIERLTAERDAARLSCMGLQEVCERLMLAAIEPAAPSVSAAKLKAAIRAEASALHDYEATPADRGGRYGPKGEAHRKWLVARGAMLDLAAKENSHE